VYFFFVKCCLCCNLCLKKKNEVKSYGDLLLCLTVTLCKGNLTVLLCLVKICLWILVNCCLLSNVLLCLESKVILEFKGDNIVCIERKTNLFCCPLQRHPLWGLRHISSSKLLPLEKFFPGYQLVIAPQFLRNEDKSRTAPEAELLPGEGGASPECQWWVCAGAAGGSFPPPPRGWGAQATQPGSFCPMGTPQVRFVVSSQDVATPPGLEGTRAIPQ